MFFHRSDLPGPGGSNKRAFARRDALDKAYSITTPDTILNAPSFYKTGGCSPFIGPPGRVPTFGNCTKQAEMFIKPRMFTNLPERLSALWKPHTMARLSNLYNHPFLTS